MKKVIKWIKNNKGMLLFYALIIASCLLLSYVNTH